MCEKTINEKKIAHRTSFVTILGNLLLSAFKFVAGLLSMSQALISDAIDSLGDVVSSFIVMIGLKISSKKKTKIILLVMSVLNQWQPLFWLLYFF